MQNISTVLSYGVVPVKFSKMGETNIYPTNTKMEQLPRRPACPYRRPPCAHKFAKELFPCSVSSCIVLGWLWVTNVWQLYLALRQYKLLKETKEKPEELSFLDDDKFYVSRNYALDKISHSMINCLYTLLLNTVEIKFGLYEKYWRLIDAPNDDEFAHDYLWITVLMLIYLILDLPVAYYDSCVIKNKYNVLHKSKEEFFQSEIRFSVFLVSVIGPIMTFALDIIKRIKYFWFWSWSTMTLTLLFLVTLYPAYISPLIYKHESFGEGSLKRSIKNFMDTFGMRVTDVFSRKGCRVSEHSSIKIVKRLTGHFVVVDKTDLTNNEILAILAHEIGHNYYKHQYKSIVMHSLYYFILFTTFSCFFSCDFLFSVVGFKGDLKPKIVNMVAIVFYIIAPLNKFIRYFINLFSREAELEADKFAVECGMGEELIETIIKKSQKIDVICVFDPLYSKWALGHPTMPERLKAIQTFIRMDDVSVDEDDLSRDSSFSETTFSLGVTDMLL